MFCSGEVEHVQTQAICIEGNLIVTLCSPGYSYAAAVAFLAAPLLSQVPSAKQEWDNLFISIFVFSRYYNCTLWNFHIHPVLLHIHWWSLVNLGNINLT